MKSAFFEKNGATPIVPIQYTNREGFSTQFWLKRDDLIDPHVSGNKWRKLKFNIKHAITHNYQGVASFGGAFSNHIAALAFAAHKAGLNSVGFIRCDQIDPNNPTLALAKTLGMKLHPLSRGEYRQRHQTDFIANLQAQYPNFCIIPEGGSNELALDGLQELAAEINQQGDFDVVASAVGSGGTIAGLSKHCQQKTLGVAVVKDNALYERLSSEFPSKLQLHDGAMFGGYAKFNLELEQFCVDFFEQTQVVIEPIYTGKLMYALCHQRAQLGFDNDTRILAIHTGGLQGLKGLAYRRQIDLPLWSRAIQSLAL